MKQQKRRNIRVLLQTEIDHNIAWLKMIKEMLDLPEGPDKIKSWGAISYYLNGISFDIWRSLTTELPSALTADELEQVISHYAILRGALDARSILITAAKSYLTGEEDVNPNWGNRTRGPIDLFNRELSISEKTTVVQEYIAAALEDYPKLNV